jgi:hypothetical protein
MFINKWNGAQGFKFPNGNQVMSHMFANDIALFLVSKKNNLDKTRQSLDLFAITFVAKLNMHKSINGPLDFSKRNNL